MDRETKQPDRDYRDYRANDENTFSILWLFVIWDESDERAVEQWWCGGVVPLTDNIYQCWQLVNSDWRHDYLDDAPPLPPPFFPPSPMLLWPTGTGQIDKNGTKDVFEAVSLFISCIIEAQTG